MSVAKTLKRIHAWHPICGPGAHSPPPARAMKTTKQLKQKTVFSPLLLEKVPGKISGMRLEKPSELSQQVHKLDFLDSS